MNRFLHNEWYSSSALGLAPTKLQPLGLKESANKLQYLELPLKAGSKSESIPMEPHIQIPKKETCFQLRTEKNVLVCVTNFPIMTTVLRGIFNY